ncbi:unnamed protein product [Cuscuta europaea]|uniref:Uncharacterized protein n=1 Tax=Cuscuta europaea TaxID=41803 RepID=A0A9P0ZBP2_CUSEU|nr:unnamed protein product [Cuscuta europaea]
MSSYMGMGGLDLHLTRVPLNASLKLLFGLSHFTCTITSFLTCAGLFQLLHQLYPTQSVKPPIERLIWHTSRINSSLATRDEFSSSWHECAWHNFCAQAHIRQ